ncbi:hypothetical protein CWI75_08180 [Kineobactrum sediminis]|uniref:TOTE conflict systems S1/CSD-like domain-containing protein n=1 Tax=Kineobactrum sediminis TaxID=1905677 RepID=A0A2N5Y4R8_9GAMM|nr:tetratricopeptide repeat protein [Kineobactrum sediminis]PLW83361.1 hypothetical protein CWI75_08180 [Kineobactrum sediminis]
MEEPLFRVITNLRKAGNLAEAWEVGCPAVQENPQDAYLKGSFFWVCYDYLKQVQAPIKQRAEGNNGNMQPNQGELDRINFLTDWIVWLNIPTGGFEYRTLLLVFQKNLEFLPKLILLLFVHNGSLFESGDEEPYPGEKGESPSLMLNFGRKVTKAWLVSEEVRQIEISDLRTFLAAVRSRVKDQQNKIWLDYDEAKCLIAVGELDEARDLVLPVLRNKQTESWAWGALAATYRKESNEAAISLYAQGILSAHEDTFILPQLAAIAKLLAQEKFFDAASKCVKRAIECYETNGWRIKPNFEQLTSADWYDPNVDSGALLPFLRDRAASAPQYLYDGVHVAHGLVINLHKNGKGLHLYLAPGEEVSLPLRIMSKGSNPSLGDYLEVQLGEDGDRKVVLAAKSSEPVDLQGVSSTTDALRVTDKGFGFVGDTFVPAHLIHECKDGDSIDVLRYRSYDNKKSQYGWKALRIRPAS